MSSGTRAARERTLLERVLEVIGAAAVLLVEEEEPVRPIPQVLELLTRARGASFACVCRATSSLTGDFCLKPRYSWVADNSHFPVACRALERGSEHWREVLVGGQAIDQTLEAPDADEEQFGGATGITLRLLPITVATSFWGALALGLPEGWEGEEEAWDVSALSIMAKVLGAALHRHNQGIIAERQYRSVLESTRDMVFSHDLEGRFMWMNQAGLDLLGYSRDELVALRVQDVVAPEYIDLAREMSVRKLAGGISATTYELEMLSKRGQRLCVEISSSVVHEGGRLAGVQGMARDVSERRRLEDQLRQSQKMDAVGRLAGGIVHDFNNIITVIQGCSEMLRSDLPPDSPLQDDVGQIERAGGRAADLTRQLLAFSRKQLMVPKVVDLNQKVREMEQMLRRVIGEDIVLLTTLESKLDSVRVDPNQIEQVILNLAVNARDAMPRGGTLRLVTGTRRSHSSEFQSIPPGDYVQLLVCDSGCGMDATTLVRAFEPFFTTKEVGRGTGLGLSTVYGIVKQSGGHIFCESRLGEGTTFRVCLPRAVPIPIEESPAGEETGGGRDHRDATIMVVEDDPTVLELIVRVLRNHGFQVIEATDGKDALAKCDDSRISLDLLITDVVMPHMSGTELAKVILERFPDIDVLFMSGYSSVRDEEPLAAFPHARHLSKPFSPTALITLVNEMRSESVEVDSDQIQKKQRGSQAFPHG